jgi:hypothetical protein
VNALAAADQAPSRALASVAGRTKGSQWTSTAAEVSLAIEMGMARASNNLYPAPDTERPQPGQFLRAKSAGASELSWHPSPHDLSPSGHFRRSPLNFLTRT